MDKLAVLKEYFGYDSFRGGQQKLIDEILLGHDVVGIMPTGAGKSLCYQIPALCFSGVTIVVSPLISLMKDQVESLIQSGVAAAFLNSSLNERQYPKALANLKNGMYKIVYVAPERLLNYDFISACQCLEISFVAIDEAHCISRWGQDFRPSYTQIPKFLSCLRERPVLAGFTATATQEVKNDIVVQLEMKNCFELVTGFDRPNLFFELRKPENKNDELLKILEKNKNQCGIVYCMTRKSVDEVYEFLTANGYTATRYHAGLSTMERQENQDKFLYDQCDIVVATNAFGMGIDKSNVRFVVHYNMTMDIESYYQEAGRAGRDGLKSDCILLFAKKDISTAKFLIERGHESAAETDSQLADVLIERSMDRLNDIVSYCYTSDCLREHILRYFGEPTIANCDNCSNCKQENELVDITNDSMLIFSCIKNTGERFGAVLISQTLKGGKSAQLEKMGLTKCVDYAKASSQPVAMLQDEIRWLIMNGFVAQSDGKFTTLQLTDKSRLALETNEQIFMKRIKNSVTYSSKSSTDISPEDFDLFEQLRALRLELATKQHVPAFVIFSDATLKDMCVKRPTSIDSFMMINGVGRKKQEAYGAKFLKLIREFTN